MIPVRCRTSLDLVGEQWPTKLSVLPPIGSLIESATEWKEGFHLTLRVASICMRLVPQYPHNPFPEWIPEITLSLEAGESIMAFYKRYAPKVGREVGSFI